MIQVGSKLCGDDIMEFISSHCAMSLFESTTQEVWKYNNCYKNFEKFLQVILEQQSLQNVQ